MSVSVVVRACLGLGFSFAPGLLAQSQWRWQELPGSGTTLRSSASLIADPLRHTLVLFGGYRNSQYIDELQLWDGANWRLGPTGPAARCSHAMAFDAARGRALLFGGQGISSLLGDTWEWDGVQWTQRVTAGAPPPRSGHAMAYQGNVQRVLLYGGNLRSDTWEWDGVSWRADLFASGPGGRDQAAMVYDEARQQTYLFGGLPFYATARDAYSFDGTQWTRMPPASDLWQGQINDQRLCFDPQRNVVIRVGGYLGGFLPPTMEFDGTCWRRLETDLGLYQGAMVAYDETSRRVVSLAQPNSQQLPPRLLELQPNAPATAQAYGAGCGTPPVALDSPAAGLPRIGARAIAAVHAIPAGIAFVAMGMGDQTLGGFQLPVTLAAFGMPGCDLLHTCDVASLLPTVATASGEAEYRMDVPSTALLIGTVVLLQAWTPAPGANAAGLLVSNGLRWTFGNQ